MYFCWLVGWLVSCFLIFLGFFSALLCLCFLDKRFCSWFYTSCLSAHQPALKQVTGTTWDTAFSFVLGLSRLPGPNLPAGGPGFFE